jgi:L-alanine-DL-glutamate epimerase-like enolase superfamily enzyme
MRIACAQSALPLIADESCAVQQDIERCADCFHGVNIKLVKCGGLTPARRMLEHARKIGLRTMIGCMTESSVGISAAAQLLPMVDDADLDGAVLLSRDIATGVVIDRGLVRYPVGRSGCGADFSSPVT